MTYQEALKAQDVARERYEDLCEYFNNNPHTIELILNDRKEFKAWLERMHWHVLECDNLARKLEALEGKDTDVHSKDITSRADAIDAVTYAEDGKDAQRLLEELLSAHPDCADCIMHGGDYECDYVHCHKGGKSKLSAQPEIIRCKDCYWHDVCKYGQYLGLEGYCSKAEEKNNGKTN